MSNKVTKVLALTLLSVIGLTACDNDVQAKPQNYKDPVVALTETEEEIYHNLMSIIEDAYRDGTLPTDVLDRILYTYSISVFGRYNKVAKPTSMEETTLEEAVEQIIVDETTGKVTGVASDHAKLDAFIEGHKAYWSTNTKGERVPESERGLTEYARVRAKWDTIEDRISRAFYDAIKSSYKNDRGYFSELKYLQDLKSQMKHVRDYKNIPDAEMVLESDKVVVTPDMQEEEVFTTDVTASKKLLNRKNYQDAANGVTYIEDDIIPTIYRSLLVEQYLLDESYNNLGRSAARKVNIISIGTNSNNDKAANYLMKYFVRNVISDTSAAGVANEIDIQDFKEVSNAYKGLVDGGVNAYLDKVNTAFAGAFPYDATNQFYVGTDYGDMMANYIKIKDDINTTDNSLESDFTGSYTHTKEVGKEIKENEIKCKDYVTDGWFVKNDTVGDLPDSIKTRLFNIGIANVLDNEGAATDRFVKGEGDTYSYKAPDNESKLIAKINGKYYLKVSSKQSGALPEDDILFNEGGKYYVVQVEEAVSGSKLAKDSSSQKYDASRKEDIINEVARVVANNDTYKTASTKHWLEQAAIKYHDTKIYDYFKENYPDLF